MRKNLIGVSILLLAAMASSYTTSRLIAAYRPAPDDPGCIQTIQVQFGWCDSYYCLNWLDRNVVVNGVPQPANICLDQTGSPALICFPDAFVWNDGDPVILRVPINYNEYDTYSGHLTSWRDAGGVWHVGFCVTLFRSPIGDP